MPERKNYSMDNNKFNSLKGKKVHIFKIKGRPCLELLPQINLSKS